jgi:hypothetical protein
MVVGKFMGGLFAGVGEGESGAGVTDDDKGLGVVGNPGVFHGLGVGVGHGLELGYDAFKRFIALFQRFGVVLLASLLSDN